MIELIHLVYILFPRLALEEITFLQNQWERKEGIATNETSEEEITKICDRNKNNNNNNNKVEEKGGKWGANSTGDLCLGNEGYSRIP